MTRSKEVRCVYIDERPPTFSTQILSFTFFLYLTCTRSIIIRFSLKELSYLKLLTDRDESKREQL
jgi:hypothetical protein